MWEKVETDLVDIAIVWVEVAIMRRSVAETSASPNGSTAAAVLGLNKNTVMAAETRILCPMRHPVEPEAASSESAGSLYAPRTRTDSSKHNNHGASNHRQLFDPRKDD
jgi:hypothetical protein